ncbi:hypothetical protein G7068_11065 [Leucobacter viscericola]|uniref:WD40-like Beta Propeller Repeat n=1 Tax=Leucobacter viscericola TaxID=2714935 RepID=A0A6G7XGK0_9MICO|nr:hypothetical protein [Leucobacter viscericola]QIK63673.1 hypothetical protein G7068_11065 [Leucobacter viscericola]
MTIKKTMPASLTALAIVGAALTGCAPSGVPQEPAAVSDVKLEPIGDSGRWFSEAYAEGVDAVYSTTNKVCGITKDHLIVEAVRGPGFRSRVQAHSLAPSTGAGIIWELTDMDCGEDAVYGDSVLVKTSTTKDESTWQLADASTGELKSKLPLTDDHLFRLKQLTEVDGIPVFLADDERVIGVGTDRILWTRYLSRGRATSVVVLKDGHLGMSNSDSKGNFTVIDGATGDDTVSMKYSNGEPSWTNDGFSLLERQVKSGGYDIVFYDLEGTETHRFKDANYHTGFIGMTPSPDAGVTFSTADRIKGEGVFAVDASGTPAMFFSTGNSPEIFTRKGKLDKNSKLYDGSQREGTPPASYNQASDAHADMKAVSKEGTMFLYPGKYEVPKVFIYDLNGNLVFEWSTSGNYFGVAVEGGYITINEQDSTQVLLPPWNPDE